MIHMEVKEILGRKCYLYTDPNPSVMLVQPVAPHDIEGLSRQVEVIKAETKQDFLLVALKIEDWNKELSPWQAPAVFRGGDFGADAVQTLQFLEKDLCPKIYADYCLASEIPMILGGYSLAALFTLWTGYHSTCFKALAACSPSVWFPQWLDYIQQHRPLCPIIYTSLGNQESHTKHKMMATVADCMKVQCDVLKDSTGLITTFEWTKGNHFQETELRCARGFVWCMQELKKMRLANRGDL